MDPRIVSGMQRHFLRFDARLAAGEHRFGYKVAFNSQQLQATLGIPFSLVAGMTETSLHPPEPYGLAGSSKLGLEAEVAAILGEDVQQDDSMEAAATAVRAFAPAIEVVDFDRPLTELEEVLAEGVFHRAVALGDHIPVPQGANLRGIPARIRYNGAATADIDAGDATGDVPALLLHLAKLLARYGQRLKRDDVVILGSMTKVVFPDLGDRFSVQLANHAPVALTFT